MTPLLACLLLCLTPQPMTATEARRLSIESAQRLHAEYLREHKTQIDALESRAWGEVYRACYLGSRTAKVPWDSAQHPVVDEVVRRFEQREFVVGYWHNQKLIRLDW